MQRDKEPNWLHRLHPGLFGMPLGLLSLSFAWSKYSHVTSISTFWIERFFLVFGLLILCFLATLWSIKAIFYPNAIKEKFLNPVLGPMMAFFPISTMLAIALLFPRFSEYAIFAYTLTAIALLIQVTIAWRVVYLLSMGNMPPDQVTPALYIPIVPGGLVGGAALTAIGLPGFGYLVWGMGLGGWALLEMRILHRLFAGPLPPQYRATIGIEMGPAAISTITAVSIWPNLPVDAILVGLGVASGPIFAVLTRWKSWTAVPFSFGFWSFAFPVAATTSCIIEAVIRGGWQNVAATIAITIATALVIYLLLRTLVLLIKRKLY
jgi:tellurite resistance protein